MHTTIELAVGNLSLSDINHLLETNASISLPASAWTAIKAAEEVVHDVIQQDKTVYGINTGFGLLANTKILAHDLEDLQRRILLSHAAGVGDLLPTTIVQLILLLKINSLARGYSGVRPIIIETLVQFYNHGIYPCIPSKGSVGASGDLAPLAHLSLPLIGEGMAHYQNKMISGAEALKIIQQTPLKLAPKEGLALINGTQVSTAIALVHLLEAQNLLSAAITIGAVTVDSACGSATPFNARIHEIRGQQGQIKVAEKLRSLLHGSDILSSHINCERVQDPYCLRCQPQVLGACLDNLLHAEHVLTIEANAVPDNPLIFADEGVILSGGNFHAEPVAQVADLMAIAIAEIGALAERRIALLVDPHFNGGLPAFLVPNPGTNSGFMIAHVTAAALASANKALAHPFSVDSLPTSANQEDHVSMATYAAWRLREILENVRSILAIELLAACQGVDLRRPLRSSPAIESVVTLLRTHVPFLKEDRFFAPDIQAAATLIAQIDKIHNSV
jgi:histidine ammonia-lyase